MPSSIGLQPGAETDLWVAVVAGQNDAAFAQNADAAAEDIRAQRQALITELAAELESPVELEWSYTAPSTVRAAKKPVCGKDCMLKLRGERGARPASRMR